MLISYLKGNEMKKLMTMCAAAAVINGLAGTTAFLNHRAPNPMGYGYAVFGEVTKGQDVVDKIALVESGNVGYFADVPKTSVVIEKITIKENAQMKKTLALVAAKKNESKNKVD